MNGIPQPFTEEFIAASLLGFDSIDLNSATLL